MDLDLYFIDWKKALAFKDAGTFDTEFDKARDRKRSWVEPSEELSPLDSQYFEVARAYRALRTALPPKDKKTADQFFDAVIAENSVCQDFGDEPLFRCDEDPDSRFLHSISPESAAKLSTLGHQLDLSTFRVPYYSKVKRRDQEVLAKSFMHDAAEESFEECFRPYVELWLELIDQAVAKKKGILTEMS